MTVHNKIKLLQQRKPLQVLTLAVSLAVVGIYAWMDRYPPLPDYWNTLALDLATALLALAAAVMSLLLIRQFGPGEKPRLVWIWFTLGWWSWVLGELTGAGYDIFRIPYGDLSVFDVFWTLGYLCFGLALFFQYRNIYHPERQFKPARYFLLVVLVFLATLVLTRIALRGGLGQGISPFVLYLAVFYPVCDLFIGLAALWLSLHFGRGPWGRPWWALIVFALADSVNIFLWIGGDKLVSEKASSLLDWISTMIYNSGYVVATFGLLTILLYYLGTYLPKTPPASELPA